MGGSGSEREAEGRTSPRVVGCARARARARSPAFIPSFFRFIACELAASRSPLTCSENRPHIRTRHRRWSYKDTTRRRCCSCIEILCKVFKHFLICWLAGSALYYCMFQFFWHTTSKYSCLKPQCTSSIDALLIRTRMRWSGLSRCEWPSRPTWRARGLGPAGHVCSVKAFIIEANLPTLPAYSRPDFCREVASALVPAFT